MSEAMTVLAVDDEAPALDELTYLLQKHPSIGQVRTAADATLALRELHDGGIDAVFLDINMPGLSGLELAAVLSNFAQPPAVVFVTAHDDKAVAAFDVGAVDYLLKPIRSDRLDEAVRRVMATRSPEPARAAPTETVARTPTSFRPNWAGSRTWYGGTPSGGWKQRATTPGCTRNPVPIWCGYR